MLLFRPPRLNSKFEESVAKFGEDLSTAALRQFIKDNVKASCVWEDELLGRGIELSEDVLSCSV